MKRVFHSLAELEAHSIDALNRYFDEVEFMTDKEQLEWMWANCKIVHWPPNNEYPIEHNIVGAKKYARDLIEEEMKRIPHAK